MTWQAKEYSRHAHIPYRLETNSVRHKHSSHPNAELGISRTNPYTVISYVTIPYVRKFSKNPFFEKSKFQKFKDDSRKMQTLGTHAPDLFLRGILLRGPVSITAGLGYPIPNPLREKGGRKHTQRGVLGG